MTGDRKSLAWVLVLGGVDPSRGAGLDADREALQSCGVDFREVITANTDQDAEGVRSVGERESSRWLFEGLAHAAISNPDAIKFGLLPSADAVRAACSVVDQTLFESPGIPVVVDPILASSSGHVFLEGEGVEALLAFCSRPLILTPNLPEAAQLLGWDRDGIAWTDLERVRACEELLEMGLLAVVLKDGHGVGDRVRNLVLERGGTPSWVTHERSVTVGGRVSMRGTGCRFASYLAGRLAFGDPLKEAAGAAGRWVAGRITQVS